MRVLIIGAGIGGLATALCLHAVGINAQVIDRVRRLRPLGVGINLQPHATEVLAGLGLEDALARVGIPTAELVHVNQFGDHVWRQPRGRALGHSWPQYSVHRGELQEILLAAVRTRLGPGAVRTGLELRSLTRYHDRVCCRVFDRGAGAQRELTAQVVVGADGLHSAVRASLHPEDGQPRWNGIWMWRGASETQPFATGRTMVVMGSNRCAKLVAYPISRHAEERGRALVNWVAEVRVGLESGADSRPDWSRLGRVDDVLPHFAGWRFAGLDIPALIVHSRQVLEYPMVDRDPLPTWGRGRVTLLGDAAHPMYPVGSNGASQAILDAEALAERLASAGDPVTALTAYENLRRPTTTKLVLANREMRVDTVLDLVSTRAPDGFSNIETILSRDELATIDACYARTSATGKPDTER